MRVRLKHERLALELARSSISLNRWAQRLGLSSGHLSQLVNGRRVYVRAETRDKLLRGLDLSFEELFEIQFNRQLNDPPESDRLSSQSGPENRSLRVSPELVTVDGGDGVVASIQQDILFGFRQCKRNPAFALVAILTLTIGIGSITALFSVVHAVVFQAYPFAEPEQLYQIGRPRGGDGLSSLSFPDYHDLSKQSTTFAKMAAHDWEPYTLGASDGALRVGGQRVTHGLFDVLGVEPLLGRAFTLEEDQPRGEPVVILGEGTWTDHFGADSSILGRKVLVNSEPRTVIGVMPSEAAYPDFADIWVPLARDANEAPRGNRFLQVTGRLAMGATPASAHRELSALADRLAAEYPASSEELKLDLMSLRDANLGPVQAVFLMLLGVAGFILMIVCANLANILLARGVARRSEMALRNALGASRPTIIRQLLTELMSLAAIGGGLGFLLGWWGTYRMLDLVPTPLPAWVQVEMNVTVMLFTAAVSLAAVLMAGLFPALQASRSKLATSLKDGGRTLGASMGRHRFRSLLVASEVALSTVLLVGAGLMIRNVLQLSNTDPGFETSGRLTVGMDMLAHLEAPIEERVRIFQRFQERLQVLPGVESVGAIDRMPLKGAENNTRFSSEGQSDEDYRHNPSTLYSRTNAGYFEAMGIPFLRGSTFPERSPEGDVPVVVSRQFQEAFWPGQDAVGQRVTVGSPNSGGDWFQITGVVADVHHVEIQESARPTLYFPNYYLPLGRMTWVLAVSGDPLALAPLVRSAVADVDPNQPIHEVLSLQQVVDFSYWQWKFFGTIFWLFAAVALALGAVGIYGLMAHSVSERTREVGIRMALGARRTQVQAQVLWQGGILVMLGIGVGLVGGFGVGKVLAAVLFNIRAFDAVIFGGVALILTAVATLAIFVPAHRASRVDPIIALRYE